MRPHEFAELAPPAVLLRRGSRGKDVVRLQAWLTLHGQGVSLDGIFGPATEAAVKAFQAGYDQFHMGDQLGAVGPWTWEALTYPMQQVVEWKRGPDFAHAIVDCAHAHLAARPREVGGPNLGPWVRLYMDGNQGRAWPWCAGFATYVLRQALGEAVEQWRTFDCDELASRAMSRGRFRRWEDGVDGIKPGSLFLIRRDFNDWIHTGIVTKVEAECFHTIEGNTNDSGKREGYEVTARIRAFNERTDFVLLGDAP